LILRGSIRRIIPAVVLSCLLVLFVGDVVAAIDERTALQDGIESGNDLSPRAKKVLFSSRNRQDESRFADAARVVSEWIDGHPDQPHHLLFFNLAVSQLSLDQPREALENLERAVALESRFARGWLRLGEAAYDQENYTRAAEAFLLGYNLMCDPLPEIRYYSAVAWLLGGQPEKAVSGMDGLLKEHGDSAPLDWYQALVAAANEAGQYDTAEPWVENCLVNNESDAGAWYLAYQFSAAREDYKEAAVRLTVVSHLRPLKQDEFFQLGDLYAGNGIPLQAARYYQQAMSFPEKEPGHDDYLRLASAWMAAYQMEEARSVLDRAISAGPSVKLLALLGDLNYSERKFQAARDVFGRCVALDPEYGRGWLMSGYCSLELGEKGPARTSLERAKAFPDQGKVARELLKRLSQ